MTRPEPATAAPAPHAALLGQGAPRWPAARQWLERLHDAARPRFLSSVLTLGLCATVVALGLAALGDALPAVPWPWPGP
jgi:hypothetical protein